MSSTVSALLSPLAFLRLPKKSWALLGAYLLCAAAVLFWVRDVLVTHQHDLEQLILDYFFPESWHFAAELVIDRFFEAQQRAVVINLVIATALMMVTVLLFWLKELVSASFEVGAKLTERPVEEHPLLEQGWQEIKLLFIFFAAQGSIFWIGYQPSAMWKTVALYLSYLFLFITYSIDFISPVFQRHLGRYSQILKTLAKNPGATLVFGAIFALPTIIVGRLWEANDEWSWQSALALLFGVNVVTIAWACISGTWLGARMMASFESTKRSSIPIRLLTWLIVMTLVVGNGYAFGAVGLSIHHKSQILKCDYDVAWTSFGFEPPGLADLLKDEIEVGFHFEVEVENPTRFDVELEKNRLEVRHKGDVVATTSLAPFAVASGEKHEQRVEFTLSMTPSMIKKGRELLDGDAWQLVLYIEVAPGFDFPVYLFGFDDDKANEEAAQEPDEDEEEREDP